MIAFDSPPSGRDATPSTLSALDLAAPVRERMSHDFTALRGDQTTGEALESLRGRTLAEKIVYFYVVDADGRLSGVVPTRRLLMSEPRVRVAELMVKRVIAIPDSVTVADACEFFVLHRLLAFPVVDREKRIVGVVDVRLFTDEVFDLAERRSYDEVFQVLGVRLAGRRGSPWASFQGRFPWLLCNMGGGIACAVLTGRYEAFLGSAIVVALFVPVVLTLAESVSMQSMAITVHSLHEPLPGGIGQSVARELATATLLGVACGAVVGGVAWAWKGMAKVALALSGSIALSVVTACLLGVLLPTLVHALRGDPRISAGPIVLAAADVATLLFYFNLSAALLS